MFDYLYKENSEFISPLINQISIPNTNIHTVIMSKISGSPINLTARINDIYCLNRHYSSIKLKDLSGLPERYYFNDIEDEFSLFHPTNPHNPITGLHWTTWNKNRAGTNLPGLRTGSSYSYRSLEIDR